MKNASPQRFTGVEEAAHTAMEREEQPTAGVSVRRSFADQVHPNLDPATAAVMRNGFQPTYPLVRKVKAGGVGISRWHPSRSMP